MSREEFINDEINMQKVRIRASLHDFRPLRNLGLIFNLLLLVEDFKETDLEKCNENLFENSILFLM